MASVIRHPSSGIHPAQTRLVAADTFGARYGIVDHAVHPAVALERAQLIVGLEPCNDAVQGLIVATPDSPDATLDLPPVDLPGAAVVACVGDERRAPQVVLSLGAELFEERDHPVSRVWVQTQASDGLDAEVHVSYCEDTLDAG